MDLAAKMRLHRSSTQFLSLCLGVLVVIIIIRQMSIPTRPSYVRKPPPPTTAAPYLHEKPWQTEPEAIFEQNYSGYNTARIPAIIFNKGQFLAFSEGRKDTAEDIGRIDLLVKRGTLLERKVIWGDIQVIASLFNYRLMNPSPIIERELDIIVLVFTGIPAWVDQFDMIRSGVHQQKVFMVKSFDNGESWTGMRDITDWTIGRLDPPPSIFAPGPGHGIQLASGRLMFAANYFVKDEPGMKLEGDLNFLNSSNYVAIFWSDNGGQSWEKGGGITESASKETFSPIFANEAMLVELDRGEVCLNCRTLHHAMPRVQAFSSDGGLSFSKASLSMDLVEPGYKQTENETTIPAFAAGCQASLVGFPAPSHHPSQTSRWVLFSNPASSMFREHMSIRLSRDGCATWSVPWTIHANASAYSDLTYFETGEGDGQSQPRRRTQNFAMLYEAGYETAFEGIYFKMFNLEAVLSGIQNSTNSVTHRLRDTGRLRAGGKDQTAPK